MQVWGILLCAIGYLLFLFVVASYGDRRSFFRPSNSGGLVVRNARRSVYALSLAVYCTSWTFFGSVGMASTSGLEFLAIYVGPILAITLGYPLMRHIIGVAKSERITSVADFLASRYGKNTAVGATATVIAVLGTVPYIALQLKAISSSVDTMVNIYRPRIVDLDGTAFDTSILVTLTLAVFAILFGTRHADATEHQDGLVLAVATESIVKLIAFLAVGLFVVYGVFGGPSDLISQATASAYVSEQFTAQASPSNFLVLTILSFCAFLLLPRQFHMGVVENHELEELKTARWMFPAYLVLINLFVIPVSIGGMVTFGGSVDADGYVLALPINADAWGISLLVFIGGLSAATAMVIVASVALAIMVSNNIVLPLMLRQTSGYAGRRGKHRRQSSADMMNRLLNIRRTSIFIMLAMAYGYYKAAGDSAALASIGLLSFAAIAQFAPAFFLGLFWRRPTGLSALCGMIAGFTVWSYTLFLPTILGPDASLMVNGPWDLTWLRPQVLFGLEANPLNHGVIFSLGTNALIYTLVTFIRAPKGIERLQAASFWILGKRPTSILARGGHSITNNELKHVVANYLGRERCERAFASFEIRENISFDGRDLAGDAAIGYSEQLLASAIGAASSRLVMSLLLQKHEPAGETTIQLLGEASEALQQNRDLLQTALDQVDQGICVFDSEFRLSNWNRQFRALLNLPASIGQVGTPMGQIADAISSRLAEGTMPSTQLAKSMLETGQGFQITLAAAAGMNADTGLIVEVLTKGLPDGGLVVSWNDITDRVRAATDLQNANETLERRVRERTEELTQLNADLAQAREAAEAANIGKTKFLAAVGHDILQPLNAARLYTSSLVEKLDQTSSFDLARNIDDSLESVEDILGAVLAISRLDSGVLAPNVTSFSVDRLFKRLEVEFRPIAEAKALKLDIISNDFQVVSDYSLLRRLLQNLISNAIKYTQNGSVRLDAKIKRNTVVFEVTDTGQGIASEDSERIFQEFQRLDEGKQAAEGLGLGLSIVQRLAHTLDHTITFESTKGSGSSFKVTVPLAALDELKQASETPKPVANTNQLALTVVCIDNEPRILTGMRSLLENWGCTVHTFEGSSQLLSALSEIEPDVVVADYHLNNETGLEIISAVRGQLGNNTPCILVTADRSAAVRNTAKAVDVTVLNKPLKPAALRAIFAGLVRHARTEAAE